jgi:hypothetical protein
MVTLNLVHDWFPISKKDIKYNIRLKTKFNFQPFIYKIQQLVDF